MIVPASGSTTKDHIKFVRSAAAGVWADLLLELAPNLAEAISAKGDHVPCPVHGGSNGFRLFPDFDQSGGGVCNTCGPFPNGINLLAWAASLAYVDALELLARRLKAGPVEKTVQAVTPREAKIDPEKARQIMRRILSEVKPIAGTAVERYLVRRGLFVENHSPLLRYHPGLPYYEKIKGKMQMLGIYPCMIAPLVANGEVISLHRTYITEEGLKAPVPSGKKTTLQAAPLNGAAIPLFAPQEVLGLAEGIETAIAARAITRIPVWATSNKTLLVDVAIPECTKHIVIFADKDASFGGQAAATALGNRLEELGISYEILLPSGQIPPGSKGLDWLDVLTTQGIEGFPVRWRNWRR